MKIYVMGPSGAGTTTLGRSLAQSLQIYHEDSDNIFWEQTDPPFIKPREQKELHRKFIEFTKTNESFVLSGDVLNWGIPNDYLLECFTHVIYLYAPWEVRKARIKAREEHRFGPRIRTGGDMSESHEAFLEWASHYETGLRAGRSMSSQRNYLKIFRDKNGSTLEILDPREPEEVSAIAMAFLNS